MTADVSGNDLSAGGGDLGRVGQDMPPPCASTPNEPREAVLTVPPTRSIRLPVPVATTAWLELPLPPPSVAKLAASAKTVPPPLARIARLSVTATAPVPSVMFAPFAEIWLPAPDETSPRWPVAACTVARVLPSKLITPPSTASAPI
ncbi:hypothetical protein [Bosea sp. 2RAB26]|uniref:hypothetical protein n=1 Tax=Bosea sp. 2RAB26 TaxID=3237476 RepID=UPI003F929616